jgi:hypothetical protein
MTPQQLGLLFVQLAVSIGVLAFLGVLLLRSHESRHKYRLFAVRDKFLYLAATGVLPQTGMVFKVFYRAMNAYISELESVTIVSFFHASVALRTELEKENKDRLQQSLQRTDPEVQATITEFLNVVMAALRYNSPMLNLILMFAHHCAGLFVYIGKLRHFELPVYDTYRYYEKIHGKFGHV